MNPRLKIATLSLASVLALVACGGDGRDGGGDGGGAAAAAGEFPITVETCGRKVTIEKPPQRVMTVGAEAPGLIWAAGAADQLDIIAATFGERLGAPEGTFDNARKITPLDEEPAKEVILGDGPDLLLGYGLTATPWQDLDAVGIDQIVVSGQCDTPVDDGPELDSEGSFEQIYRDVELYGRLFGTTDIATRAVADLQKRVATVHERFHSAPARTATVLAFYNATVYVYGAPSIAQDQMEALGLTNAFAAVDNRRVELNVEELLARNPDVLIVAQFPGQSAEDARKTVQDLPGGDRLRAVRDGNIIPVESQAIVGGLQSIEGLESMAEALAKPR